MTKQPRLIIHPSTYMLNVLIERKSNGISYESITRCLNYFFSYARARSRRQQRFREIKNMHVGRLNGHNFW